MSLLQWNPSYSIGIDEVDAEHRAMIEEINRTHAALDEHPTAADAVARLGEIVAHISAHFALEERNMRERRYPALGPHKDDHERLIDVLLEIEGEVDTAGTYDPATLASALDEWFGVHFRTHDARLQKFVAGVAPSDGAA